TGSVVDTRSDNVVKTIRGVGQKPHGIAITEDGPKVLGTQLLALTQPTDPRPRTQSEGAENGREGRVPVIDARQNTVLGAVALTPLAHVGAAFKSDGNTLARAPLSPGF